MKVLIIQTAFLGDVVLATPLLEKLRRFFPSATLDFLLREGNEGLLTGHPHLRNVLIWRKKEKKMANAFRLLQAIRRERYDLVVNCHRFLSSGIFTVFSGAKETVGFDKNPLSRLFSRRIPHRIGLLETAPGETPMHETDRNLALVAHRTDASTERPKLHPTLADFEKAEQIRFLAAQNAPDLGPGFVTISPASVWFTKQFPREKWVELLRHLPKNLRVFLLGGPPDAALCEEIKVLSGRAGIENLAGRLTFLQSAALMAGAEMNYVNDSAPMHFASAMNAPVTAVFCSTVPEFGFGPLSDRREIWQVSEKLDCRPCGLHGFRACPKGHFRCTEGIEIR